MNTVDLLFYFFATLAVGGGILMVFSRHPVSAALFSTIRFSEFSRSLPRPASVNGSFRLRAFSINADRASSRQDSNRFVFLVSLGSFLARQGSRTAFFL